MELLTKHLARPNLSNLYLLLAFLWMTHSLSSLQKTLHSITKALSKHTKSVNLKWSGLQNQFKWLLGRALKGREMAMIMKVLLVKKEEWSSEAHNLECYEDLDLGLDLDLDLELSLIHI